MLQNLRENLKGAVAVFVLLIFIVPLVLFGVEQLFVGSVGGSDAATVNGEEISSRELQRQIMFEKASLQQRFDLSPTDPQLDDSALRGPALERLIQRSAMVQAADEGGMGASTEALWKEVAATEAFQVDGQFDPQIFKQRIGGFMFTPATYIDSSGKDYVIRQLSTGLSNSTFVTDSDIALIASITQQKRTFYSVTIPKSLVEGAVEVTSEEVQKHYEENEATYKTPERVSVEYVEVSLDSIAQKNPASDEDVKAAYDIEVEEFSADPKYSVAHILVEDGEEAEKKLADVKSRLDSGEAFSEVAKALSDDLGSKDSGGDLGQLVASAFPKEFVAAVEKLSVGETSAAVKTDAGTHFIQLLGVSNNEPPSFEERKDALANQLARSMAAESFVTQMEELDKLTFGVDSLAAAAEALGVEVQVSPLFTRSGGAGVAADRQVVDAAFADDVFKEQQNSRVLELSGEKALVLRLKEHEPEALKPLEEVEATIKTQLTAEKVNTQLEGKAQALKQALIGGADAQALAGESEYLYELIEASKRNNFDVDRFVMNKAFSMPRPGDSPVFETVTTAEGVSVVALTQVEDGVADDLSEQELTGLKGQLNFQLGQSDLNGFQEAVLSAAKVDQN